MNWRTWLLNYSPSDWTIEKKLSFINNDCPEVTMQDIINTLQEFEDLKNECELNSFESEHC